MSTVGQRKRIYLACLVLILATAATAIALVPFNLEFGGDLWTDPQSDDQVLGQWRAMAAFAYTSGGWACQAFALASGVLVARWTAHRDRRVGLAAAAGLGLGLTDLVAAWSRAAPELHQSGPVAVMGGRSIDSALVHHSCVISAMGTALLLFAITAIAGFGIGVVRGFLRRLALAVASAAFILLCVPVIRFEANDLFVKWATPISYGGLPNSTGNTIPTPTWTSGRRT